MCFFRNMQLASDYAQFSQCFLSFCFNYQLKLKILIAHCILSRNFECNTIQETKRCFIPLNNLVKNISRLKKWSLYRDCETFKFKKPFHYMKIKDFLNRQSNLECTMTIRNWFVKEPETNKKNPNQVSSKSS